VPAQVGTVTATPSSTQVVLAWTAPADGGEAITDYVVEQSPNGTSGWAAASGGSVSASTGQTVTGLTNLTEYFYRVAAVNAIGTGAWSANVSAIPTNNEFPTITVGTFPTYTEFTEGGGNITFTAPTASITITKYQWRFASTTGGLTSATVQETSTANATTSPLVVDGGYEMPYDFVYIQIRASNGSTPYAWSDSFYTFNGFSG
jgi:hypothetical protein